MLQRAGMQNAFISTNSIVPGSDNESQRIEVDLKYSRSLWMIIAWQYIKARHPVGLSWHSHLNTQLSNFILHQRVSQTRRTFLPKHGYSVIHHLGITGSDFTLLAIEDHTSKPTASSGRPRS